MESPLRPDPADAPLILETLRYENGVFLRLARHLNRLRRACARLDYPYDEDRLYAALATVAGPDARRVRVAWSQAGAVEVTTAPFVPITAPWRVGIARARLSSGDPWLRVKTTRREIYDAARRETPDGISEMILLNEREELCEGTITNLFVELDGVLLTPPVSSGLLPGVLREELLEQGRCREAVLRPADLSRATAIWCGNSLRGLIPAIAGDAEPAD